MEKKEINTKTTIKAIITGFVSYGIITMFICFLAIAFGNKFLGFFSGKQANGLYITVPLMAAIMLYFLIHAICRISTYDVFKKCKTNPENYKSINNYLTFFFIVCIVFSIILFSTMLYYNLKYQVTYIEFFKVQYMNSYPDAYLDTMLKDMTDNYINSKANLINSTVILIAGVSISFLSLINYQRKMLTKYNEF